MAAAPRGWRCASTRRPSPWRGSARRSCRGWRASCRVSAPFTGLWLFLGAAAEEKGLPLSTILAFDVGVYLVVLGSVLTLVFALEEEV